MCILRDGLKGVIPLMYPCRSCLAAHRDGDTIHSIAISTPSYPVMPSGARHLTHYDQGRQERHDRERVPTMQESARHCPVTHVRFTLEAGLVPVFFHLLQSGVQIQGNVGCSVKSFLCEQLGVAPEYLEKRIQTIFLDGKPVDDVDTAIVNDGTTLSVSAALPGLVGAVMRRGGYYAPLRDQISYRKETTSATQQPGKVFMKLFNLPLRELGPMFLERGILVSGNTLHEVLKAHADDFRKGCRAALVDGRNFDPDQLREIDWQNKEVNLQIKTF